MTTLRVTDAAREQPDAPAIVGETTWTYAELAERTQRLAGGIRSVVDPGHAASLVGHPEPDVIARALAAIELGVPLIMLHPRWTETERRRVEAHHRAVRIDDVEEADPPPFDRVEDHATLAVFTTSGSSGRPKGVDLTRGAFVASAAASAKNLGWRDDDRWHLDLPLAHVGGFSILTRCLLARRPVTLGEAEARAATILSLVPTQLARWIDDGVALPPSVRAILLGGAAAPHALLEEAANRGWPVLTTYGLTEACSQVATQRLGARPGRDVGVGPPLDGIAVRIVDEEIRVGGPTLMRGYTTSDEPAIVDGWLRTNDAGYFDEEGRLHVLGRRDGVIVTGGENVHPFEVEEALRALEGVRDAVVFGRADERWGSQIVAAIVATRRPTRDELSTLARFKHPRAVALLPRLATNANGKVDRRAVERDARDRLEPW